MCVVSQVNRSPLEAVATLPFHVLKQIQRLPIPIQKDAANPAHEYTIVSLRADGQVYEWKKAAKDMTFAEAKRVFGSEGPRTRDQQVSLLRMQKEQPGKPTVSASAKLAVDKRRGGITVAHGNELLFFPAAEVLTALARLNERD